MTHIPFPPAGRVVRWSIGTVLVLLLLHLRPPFPLETHMPVSPGDAAPAHESDAVPPPARTPAPTPAPALPPPPAEFQGEVVLLPDVDRELLVEEAEERERRTGVHRFAHPHEIDLHPGNSGRWTGNAASGRTWELELVSPGALSVNLGFSRFDLPPGGRLEIDDAESTSPLRSFTEADEESHGQLWTPLVAGERVRVRVSLPPRATEGELGLTLARVNAGFRGWEKKGGKIGGETSGNCNIDVACDSASLPGVGAWIDTWRDQIRSVGAYTLGGIDTCTGALVNNTAQDGRPFFLTADHCGISAANAPSMVVYWNFQNSACRAPGSAGSGGVGNGNLSQFNSGAIFRSEFPSSDMTLVELDDPVDSAFAPYFAGWDASGVAPAQTIAIHHPAVAEKRISFDLDPPQVSTYYGTTTPGDGSHWRVVDWDYGTTEGGSSGSPLFDQNGRIVGQLHGGEAACGNDLSDYYGRLSVSWQGGGGSSTQLRAWLDPLNSGATALDGRNAQVSFRVADATVAEGNTGSTLAQVRVWLEEPLPGPTSVRVDTLAGTAVSPGDYTAITNLVLPFAAGQTQSVVTLSILADLVNEEDETFELRLSSPVGAGLADPRGFITVMNDDYIPPVLSGPFTASAVEDQPFVFTLAALNQPRSFSLGPGAPSGMTVDPVSGRLTWTPASPGTQSVLIRATNPAGTDEETLTITILPNQLPVALDTVGLTWTSAPSSWFVQTAITHDGADAARSGAIGHNQTSTLSTTLAGPETVVFWWKVSSEPGYDELELRVDGVFDRALDGEQDWRREVVRLPAGGPHTLAWTYSKDGSTVGGQDAGWLDEVLVASLTPFPLVVSSPPAAAVVNQAYAYQVETSIPADTLTAQGLPAGLTLAPSGLISGTPTVPGRYRVDLTVANQSGSDHVSWDLDVNVPLALALDTPGRTWSTVGNHPWQGVRDVSHDGDDAARSAPVAGGQSSVLLTIVTGPAQCSFWWKVSSESGYDKLSFTLDGQSVHTISGAVDWEQKSLLVPAGTHTLSWTYAKDGSQDVGADAGWVDQVEVGPPPAVLFTSPAVLYVGSGQAFVHQLTSEPAATSFQAVGLPVGVTLNSTARALQGTLAGTAEHDITLMAITPGGTAQQVLRISVGSFLALASAVNEPTLSFFSGGATSWNAQTVETHDGVAAARSSVTAHSAAARMRVVLPGPGSFQFWRRVSSEEDYDFLRLRVDGQMIEETSGDTGWVLSGPHALAPGMHAVEWSYEKDSSDVGGLDAAWLDQLSLTGYTAWAVAQAALVNRSPAGNPDADTDTNFVEYALGRDPMGGPGGQTPSPTMESGYLTLTLAKPAGVTGVRYFAESAPALSPATWAPSVVVVQDDATTFKVRDGEPAATAPRRLLRLSVEPQP